ncbi:MAG: YhbY family RNA-binding protein [Gammaproteobacteria bacterium]|nr:YhbY family RNA-binding protein [Gammaproteobacteria bacterium]
MLSGKEKNDLRGRAHGMRPVVTVGAGGAGPGVLAELEAALQAHQLVKVKLPSSDRYERAALADHLCTASGAELVQTMGRMAVLYRARQDDP